MKKPLRICLLESGDTGIGLESLAGNELFQFTRVPAGEPEMFSTVPEGSEVVVAVVSDEQAFEQQLPAWLQNNPDSNVYAVTGTADLDQVRRLMRTGVVDVFVAPVQEQEFAKELEQVMEKRDASSGGGKLITFFNAKGGNGSTTLAVNTAVDLARRADFRVLLIDLDLQFGDAAASLDLHPKSTINEALSQADRLDATLLDSMLCTTEEGLSMLASPARLDNIDAIRAREIQKLLEVALSNFDIVIVDLPRVITGWTDEVMRWSDHIFMVLQGSIASVRDSRLLREHLHALGIEDESIHYAHNRAGARHTAVTTEQLEKSLGTNRVVVIHNGYDDAIRAADMGKAVVDMAKNSPLSKDIHRLAEVVTVLCGHESAKSSGLLSRLFGNKHGEK